MLSEFHRFDIPVNCHWNDVRSTTQNVGQAIEKALRGIEQANQASLYGIFGDAQWSNKNKLSDHLKKNNQDFRTLSLYGQEKNLTSSSIARMNMFLHGIEDFQIVRGDTLRNPAFFEADGLKTFDCVIANPSFSLSNWGAENWSNDPWGRNFAGIPPKSNGVIREHDYNLNIPLYVEKVIEDNLPSVEEAMEDLKTTRVKAQEAEERFKNILQDFL